MHYQTQINYAIFVVANENYIFEYPYTWNEYEKSDINNNQHTDDYYKNQSNAYPLTMEVAITPSFSYTPMRNRYAFSRGAKWKNEQQEKLILSLAQTQEYWMSTRSVNLGGLLVLEKWYSLIWFMLERTE